MIDLAIRVQAARTTNPFLTAKQAAFHLGLAYSTLKAMRASGRGPFCRLHGRTWRYHIDDLDRWSTAQTAGSHD